MPAATKIMYGVHILIDPSGKKWNSVNSKKKLFLSPTPPDGKHNLIQFSILAPLPAKDRIVGSKQLPRASPNTVIGFLNFVERKSVKHTVARKVSKPENTTRVLASPMVRGTKEIAEKAICNVAFRLSQPNAVYEINIKADTQTAKITVVSRMADNNFTTANRRRPCFVQRKISSAPLW